MKKATLWIIGIVFLLSGAVMAFAGDKIADGLKEALQVGVQNAVKKVGVEDGFYKNADVKIPLPDKLKKADELLKKVKAEKYSEDLVKKMNRAAETAAPLAMNIFVDSVKKMQLEDAQKILAGKESEATEYLKRTSSDPLKKELYPIVKESMEKVGAIKSYNDFMDKYASNPLTEKINLDITDYVTGKAMEGLFKMVGEEEKKIRQDPAARVSDLLKDVFGGIGK